MTTYYFTWPLPYFLSNSNVFNDNLNLLILILNLVLNVKSLILEVQSDTKYEWFKRLYTKLTRFAFNVMNIIYFTYWVPAATILKYFLDPLWIVSGVLRCIYCWLSDGKYFISLRTHVLGMWAAILLTWIWPGYRPTFWSDFRCESLLDWGSYVTRMILVGRASNWYMYCQLPCWNTWYWARDDFVNNDGISSRVFLVVGCK